jgi:DNA-binding transcriptional ArsR family regulator
VVQRNEQVGEPDLAAIGAALAEAARAKILLALVGGRSLAASHLATEAGVSPPTASHHLSRLCDVGLITATARGRHRYYAIADTRVAELIEAAARIAPLQPVTSLRQGTRAHAVRYARRCYDHLAGRLGVALADALCRDGSLDVRPDPMAYRVTERGVRTLADIGIDTEAAEPARGCLDWTEQRHHIAGPLGRRLMARFLELGWVSLDSKSRGVRLSDIGRAGLREDLAVELPVS